MLDVATQPVAQAAIEAGTPTADGATAAGEPVAETLTGPAQTIPDAFGAGVEPVAAATSGAPSTLEAAGPALPDAAAGADLAAGGVADSAATDVASAVGVFTPADPQAYAPALIDELAASGIPIDSSVLLTAGLVALGGVALSPVVRGEPLAACSASARLLFTNVRLIPCFVAQSLEQYISKATAVATRLGGPPAPTSVQHSGESSAGRQPAAGQNALPGSGLLADVRSAFADANVRRGQGDGQDDVRLMTQIGTVLGLVYAAFLTVWFWATRARWNPRS